MLPQLFSCFFFSSLYIEIVKNKLNTHITNNFNEKAKDNSNKNFIRRSSEIKFMWRETEYFLLFFSLLLTLIRQMFCLWSPVEVNKVQPCNHITNMRLRAYKDTRFYQFVSFIRNGKKGKQFKNEAIKEFSFLQIHLVLFASHFYVRNSHQSYK